MNRIQFFTAIALSSLVVLFLFLQVLFATQLQHAQGQIAWAQQTVTNGRASENQRRQLALRIYQVGQQQQDQQLKDLLVRQGIAVKNNGAENSAAGSAPTPADTH
jgi:hypothetical protein